MTAQPARSRAKAVLLAVIGLQLVAETALTPFLPQLFERLYGIEDPGATGIYIWICRLVGLAALPLWGLAARRWPLHRIVVAGLCGSAVIDLLLGMAPSYAWYTALSTAVVTTNCALLLAYPAFVAEHGDDSAEGERARLTGIRALVVVFQLSTVAATLAGAAVLALPEPRVGISAFALLDIALAWLTHRVLAGSGREDARAAAASGGPGDGCVAGGSCAAPGAEVPEGAVRPAPVGDTCVAGGTCAALGAGAPEQAVPPPSPVRAPAPSGAQRAPGRGTVLLLLAQAALLGLAFDFSFNVGRPFFTAFAESLGSGALGGAVLFFLPSVAALGVLPFLRRWHDRLGDRLLPCALAVSAAGLGWQAVSGSLPALAGGRLLFGLGLGAAQVAVELRVFRATGTRGPAFTAVETARSAGLLAAPLVAAAAVSRDLALPLVVAAAVQLLATALSVRGARRRRTPDTPAAPAPPAFPQKLALATPAPPAPPEENHR